MRVRLRDKRKAKPQIDEVEDGARAAVTEEAISALIFAHARDHSFFMDATSIDYELLKAIAMMTRPFEVRARSPREWESAILRAYAVWRRMRDNRGGVFIGDAASQTISYQPTSELGAYKRIVVQASRNRKRRTSAGRYGTRKPFQTK